MKKWPCPFCYTKSKDKLQCRIHIAREHPSISRADRSELAKFCNDFNENNNLSIPPKENELPIAKAKKIRHKKNQVMTLSVKYVNNFVREKKV